MYRLGVGHVPWKNGTLTFFICFDTIFVFRSIILRFNNTKMICKEWENEKHLAVIVQVYDMTQKNEK